ncbi:host range virulence factor [Cotia virus SPAn232]|uniref:Host range virulence factor n=2 Tax=Cotia virus TaxID=39444 RepID=H6TAH7_9POXV|nr:host range virulence factor [Cotia virus SPAn232]AFB76914.1 host range virulence factor [Cotia virus SPAn232]AIT70639.1 host range virulence factor [Cotia virus]
MGITHEFEIIIDNCIALRQLELCKGDNYGCKIRIISKYTSKLNFRFIIRPVWSEVTHIKEITATVNGDDLPLNKVSESMYCVIYEADIYLNRRITTVLVSSSGNNTEMFKKYYPNIKLNLISKKYDVEKYNYGYPYIECPLLKTQGV